MKIKNIFGKKKTDEEKKNEKKEDKKKKEQKPLIKESQSTPINYNPPKKPAVIQPSSTIQVKTTNTNANKGSKEENPEGQQLEVQEGQQEAQQEEIEEEQTLVEMRKGDYNVHILIEKVKNLIPVEDNVPPVPRVKLTVFDKVKRTGKMKNPCYDFIFNEHFYFDKTNLTAEMLDSEKIIIEVYDNKNNKKEKYFGIYELDFAYVYGRPNHALKNMWIGLSNPESDDMTKIRGYLKLSISVLNESDERVELEPKEGGEAFIIPNEIKMKYKQISFYFIRGENFPDMDSITVVDERLGKNKRCQAYIVMKYMGITRRTKAIDQKNNVVLWNRVIDIPATDPFVSQKICMYVYDEDIGNPDDLIGSYEFYVEDIFKGKYSKFDYIHIYGSPINTDSKMAIQMGTNAEIASRWNGRILMKCDVREMDSPVAAERHIEDNKITKEGQEATAGGKTSKWEIWIRVISALYLPKEKGKYRITAKIEGHEERTNKKEAVKGTIDYNETIKIPPFESISSELSTLPDLFLYLSDSTKSIDAHKRICFQRIKTEEFYLNKDVFYIKLLPDPVVNRVKSMKISGLLKCKICLFNKKKDKPPDTKEFEEDGQLQLASLSSGANFFEGSSKMQLYTIVAIIYMSKGLVAAESNGTSDPYVSLTLGDKELTTTYKNNTMNGVWNEPLEFKQVYMDINDQRTWPVFSLNVFDHNKLLPEMPLGYNYLWLCNTHFCVNRFEVIKPKWHDLFLPKSNKKQGRILMSFYIFDQTVKETGEELYKKIKFLPNTMLYNFDINVLGLRELKPLSLIPVKKPFIKFDLNSTNVTGKPEDDHAPIKTIPVSGGENPTINTVIQFESKLPIEDEFLPELQCEVYDNMLSGMLNSLLGVFSINLKEIIKATKKEVQEDIAEAKQNMNVNIFGKGILGALGLGLGGVNFGNTNLLGTNNNNLINNNNNLINTSSNLINTNSNIINPNINLINSKSNIINTNSNIISTSSNLISNNNIINEGMKEKDNDHIEIEKDNDIINTNSSKSDQDALSTSNLSSKESVDFDDEKVRFLEEEDDNKFIDEETSGKVDMSKVNTKSFDFKIIPKKDKPSLLQNVRLTWEILEKNLDNPDFFVILPTPKNFHIPGYSLDGQASTAPKVEGEEEGEEKVQKELLIEDDSKVPDAQLYFKIGYILKFEEGIEPHKMTKHYRRIYRCPLENVINPGFDMSTPFHIGEIRRGKFVDKRSETELFDAMKSIDSKIIHRFGKENSLNNVDLKKSLIYKDFNVYKEAKKKKEELKKLKNKKEKGEEGGKMTLSQKKGEKSFGKFKGIIRITESNLLKTYEKTIQEYKDNLKITKQKFELKNYNKYNDLKKRILNTTEVIIRVYILEMTKLAERDYLSPSDPYVKLYLNNKLLINEKKNHQDDKIDCKWYKHYDITGEMPGSSSLKIEVMDYDDITSDDLIGYTIIDLEDRYFNSKWKEMDEKPIEIRPLINLDYQGAQGYIYLWVDIFEAAIKTNKEPWQIAPEPETEFEVRLVVWETEDMEIMDVEGTSDIYVVSYINQKDSQKTDIHYRCQDGNASFNWRNLLPLKLPMVDDPVITIQVYDKDIFSSDDYISGATLNIKDLMTIPKYLGLPVKFTKSYYEGLSEMEQQIYGDIEFLNETDDEDGIKFWVQCYKGKKEATGEGETGGRVLCTLEILPKELADKNKLGKGRSNPNKDPYCPPPTGRMECSLNPCKMINQCVGPKFRRKCYCFIILGLLLIYLIIAMPSIIGKIISPA